LIAVSAAGKRGSMNHTTVPKRISPVPGSTASSCCCRFISIFGEHALAAMGQALTKPEYYYGFIGAAASFQLVY